jgi:hypothetical protein
MAFTDYAAAIMAAMAGAAPCSTDEFAIVGWLIKQCNGFASVLAPTHKYSMTILSDSGFMHKYALPIAAAAGCIHAARWVAETSQWRGAKLHTSLAAQLACSQGHLEVLAYLMQLPDVVYLLQPLDTGIHRACVGGHFRAANFLVHTLGAQRLMSPRMVRARAELVSDWEIEATQDAGMEVQDTK